MIFRFVSGYTGENAYVRNNLKKLQGLLIYGLCVACSLRFWKKQLKETTSEEAKNTARMILDTIMKQLKETTRKSLQTESLTFSSTMKSSKQLKETTRCNLCDRATRYNTALSRSSKQLKETTSSNSQDNMRRSKTSNTRPETT